MVHEGIALTGTPTAIPFLRPSLSARIAVNQDLCFGDEACAAAFAIVVCVSPTIFRDGPFRFFFFSREEERLHVHVQSPEGEAKFWIEPEIALARSYRLSGQDLKRALQLVVEHEQEIRDAWQRHFDR